ncbi:MAG: UDP-glucose/GDP-mannose dehydrogenase family protein [Clostridiales Family XIII bacterium]|jgi:UDPglucose 6-dehydrogenase|nr:UDP-glucose/GDP-mannose dehydrogenase family protein [Clostridiales Family XIII bacterium]
MRLAVVGTGYVGLVTGACFAEYGNEVICVDNDAGKIAKLNSGVIPIFEPNLKELVDRNRALGTLEYTTDTKAAIESCDLCFICVGTPQSETGETDMRYVKAVAKDIGSYLTHDILIVDKSTVPVGTAGLVREIVCAELAKRGLRIDFSVVSNPEFLKEGDAVKNCMRPDRIIVGVEDEGAGKVMHGLYKPFVRQSDNYIEMDVKSAEMTKYAANAMLATKISFINEIANICERLGADVNQVRIGIGSDSRIGYSFIYPGIGYGGSCFPKDVKSLICCAEAAGYTPGILGAVDRVNARQKTVLADKVIARFGDDLTGLTFAVWGLSFKPNTDDVRESPALAIIGALLARGAIVRAYDPQAMETARAHGFPDEGRLVYGENKYDALTGADALLLTTEWKEFLSPDFQKIKSALKNAVIFDGRNQFDSAAMAGLGFEYYQIGAGNTTGPER